MIDRKKLENQDLWEDACCSAHTAAALVNPAYAALQQDCPFTERPIGVQHCNCGRAECPDGAWYARDEPTGKVWGPFDTPIQLADAVIQDFEKIAGKAMLRLWAKVKPS